MKTLTLTRFDYKSGDGTFGRLNQWTTLEDDWLDNRRKVSCIPTGEYVCKRTTYHRGGYEVFEVTGVPGRSRILIGHYGNTEEDVEGCIVLGLRLGVFERDDEDLGVRRHKIGVSASRPASREFMAELAGVDEFILRVVDYSGPDESLKRRASD